MARACVLLRTSDHYRADQFRAGLARHGFSIAATPPATLTPDDLLLIWNRSRMNEQVAVRYEHAGARIVVAENGYIPRTRDGGKFYALALDRHNGRGRWFVGDGPRFEIPEQPWRTAGEHIVVLPQRGIGSPGVAMPPRWDREVKERLGRITKRPVVVRPHPGHCHRANPPSLADQIAGAHCVVTWGSGAGIMAIQSGVPCFHDLPGWIAEGISTRLDAQLESCHTPDRGPLWTRVSWAQWTIEEIGSGEAFERLLHAKDRDLLRAGQSQVRVGC